MKKLKVHYDSKNYTIGNFLLGRTRTCLLNMAHSATDKKSLIVDLGCGRGHLSQSLLLIATTIGLDIDKSLLLVAKNSAKRIEFICADICHLPIRKNSVDIAVVASAFEYIEKLEDAIKQTRDIIKTGGLLVAGYPIETRFLKAMIEIVDGNAVRIWNPYKIMKGEHVAKNFHTHKHKCQTIRNFLSKHFSLILKEKIPSKYLPDSLSVYERVKLVVSDKK